MLDLEQQIAAWVDAEVDGVDPVTVDEVFGATTHQPPATTGGHRRRWATIVAAAAVVLLVGAVVVITNRDQADVDDVRAGTTTTATSTTVSTGDWKRFDEPILAWSLDRPIRTGVQSWSGRCGVNAAGSFITFAAKERVRFADAASTCSWGPSPADLAQPGVIVLAISHFTGGPYGPGQPTDTPPGLSLDDLEPVADDAVPNVEHRSVPVVISGDEKYSVDVWIADDADPADVADLRRMIETITWPTDVRTAGSSALTTRGGEAAPATGSSRMMTFIACLADAEFHPYLAYPQAGTVDGEPAATLTWPAGEQDRGDYDDAHATCNEAASKSQRMRSRSHLVWPKTEGPSQSAGDAERDGVVPALAELPLSDRAEPTRWFDTPEGTWAITKVPDGTGDDCTIGDPDGAYGTERICSSEYGEVVLVDRSGALLRAYPMPGAVPTWIYPTKDAIYAGRVGDGALPDSTIVRIDRRSFVAEVLRFPAGEGQARVDLLGWHDAPAGTGIDELVRAGDTVGPLAFSTIGVTTVDLAAVEELFA